MIARADGRTLADGSADAARPHAAAAAREKARWRTRGAGVGGSGNGGRWGKDVR